MKPTKLTLIENIQATIIIALLALTVVLAALCDRWANRLEARRSERVKRARARMEHDELLMAIDMYLEACRGRA